MFSDDSGIFETGSTHGADKLCFLQASGNSPGLEGYVVQRGLGRLLSHQDIADVKTPPGLQYAGPLLQCLPFIRGEVQHTVTDHHIDKRGGQRQIVCHAFAEFHIFGAHLFCAGSGLLQHLGSHIDADYPALGTHQPGCNHGVETRTRPDVDHCLPGFDGTRQKGVSGAGE